MLLRGAPTDPVEVEPRLWGDAAGRLAFDVGANLGQSVAHLLCRGFTAVVALEPAAESFESLQREYGADRRVDCRNVAASDAAGTLKTEVRKHPIESGQLVALQMPYEGEGTPDVQLPWGPRLGWRDVPCVTLDDVAAGTGQPDFVKVDTEGHELLVMRGASGVLAAGTRWMIEFHSDELHAGCVQLLEAAGYQVETVRHPHYPPGSYMWSRHGWIKASRED